MLPLHTTRRPQSVLRDCALSLVVLEAPARLLYSDGLSDANIFSCHLSVQSESPPKLRAGSGGRAGWMVGLVQNREECIVMQIKGGPLYCSGAFSYANAFG